MRIGDIGLRCLCFGGRGLYGAARATEQVGLPGRIESQIVEIDVAYA